MVLIVSLGAAPLKLLCVHCHTRHMEAAVSVRILPSALQHHLEPFACDWQLCCAERLLPLALLRIPPAVVGWLMLFC